MSQTPHQRLEDAFGAARSYLHAIRRLASAGLTNDRDMCALDLLAERAEAEINTAQGILDTAREAPIHRGMRP